MLSLRGPCRSFEGSARTWWGITAGSVDLVSGFSQAVPRDPLSDLETLLVAVVARRVVDAQAANSFVDGHSGLRLGRVLPRGRERVEDPGDQKGAGGTWHILRVEGDLLLRELDLALVAPLLNDLLVLTRDRIDLVRREALTLRGSHSDHGFTSFYSMTCSPSKCIYAQ